MSKRKLLPYIKIMCIPVIILMVIVLYSSTKLPFSPLYAFVHKDSDLKRMANHLNQVRLQRALKYFKMQDHGLPPVSPLGNNNHSLVICIVTMDRSKSAIGTINHRYLVQTAAAVDQIFSKDTYFKNKMFFICNVDERPQNHQDAVWLQDFIQFVHKHGSSSFKMKFFSVSQPPNKPYDNSRLADPQQIRRQKEANDYAFCLNASIAFNSSYILMLEDDVVPRKDLLEVVSYVLKQRLHVDHDEDTAGHNQPREFSYIKLYYPEKWQGYAWEMDRLLELICFGFVGAGLTCIIYTAFAKFFGKQFLMYYNLNIFLSFLLFICIASLVDRQALLELRRFSPQLYRLSPSPGCCTQGMLYNTKHLTKMMDYVINHPEINKDLAIYDFTKESQIPGFLIEPNLLHHIGMYSSLLEGYKSPREFLFND